MTAFEQAESVRRETSNVKRFEGRALGSPTFHLSRLTFYGFWERLFQHPAGGNRYGSERRMDEPGLFMNAVARSSRPKPAGASRK